MVQYKFRTADVAGAELKHGGSCLTLRHLNPVANTTRALSNILKLGIRKSRGNKHFSHVSPKNT